MHFYIYYFVRGKKLNVKSKIRAILEILNKVNVDLKLQAVIDTYQNM